MAKFNAEEYKKELLESTKSNQISQKLFLEPKSNQKFVLISYSHEDYKQVYRDLADLREKGIPFWFDDGLNTYAGKNWDDVVRQKMADPNCAGVIFYLSDSLFLSQSIQTEINIVLGKDDHPDAPKHQVPYFAVNLTEDMPLDILCRTTPKKQFVGVSDESKASCDWFTTLSAAFPNKATFLSFSNVLHRQQLFEQINTLFSAHDRQTASRNTALSAPSPKSLFEYVSSIPHTVRQTDGLFAQLRYDTCSADFYGRKQEFILLNNFLNDETSLSWWAITGPAGCGKTRLAYEFSKKVDNQPGWCARFINWPIHHSTLANTVFIPKHTDQNLLLVFDYVYAYQNEIAQWLERLQQTYICSSKIRILLIEREDKKVDASGQYIAAPWEEMFCAAPHYPLLIKQLKYQDHNINLKNFRLTEADGFAIVQSYCRNTGRYLSSAQIQYIVRTVFIAGKKNITPLSLLLLAEHYLGDHSSQLIKNPLAHALENLVERDIHILYNTLGINTKNSQLVLNRIMHVSTILGKVETTEPLLINYASQNSGPEKYWATIEALENSPVYELGIDETFFILGIQPDLVGEYYVFTRFRTMSDQRLTDLLDAIHEKYPAELGRFLIRYIEDGTAYGFDQDRLSFYSHYLPESAHTFTILNENNQEVRCEMLFTFDSEETGKSYIVYTDNTFDEEGNTKVYASIYDSNGLSGELIPITTEQEWTVIETILETLQEEAAGDQNFDSDYLTNIIDEKLEHLILNTQAFD